MLTAGEHPKLVSALAEAVERIDRELGLDGGPALAESLAEQGVPDTAYQVLIHLGYPAVDALDTVLQACERAELNPELAFELIAGKMWS